MYAGNRLYYCTHAFTSLQTLRWMRTLTYMHTHDHDVHTHTRTHTDTYIYIYIYICVCIYIYIYIHIHTHTLYQYTKHTCVLLSHVLCNCFRPLKCWGCLAAIELFMKGQNLGISFGAYACLPLPEITLRLHSAAADHAGAASAATHEVL